MFQKTARLVLEADSRQLKTAQKDLRDFEREAQRVERSASKVGKAIAGVAVAFATSAFARSVINNTIEQERAISQLNATLRSTGANVESASAQLQAYASQLQSVTTFGDEAIISAQSLLLTFTRVGDEVFPQALESILNVSTALGQDLKSSALQVGKALNDPIQGVTALARSGIQFTEQQKEQIKTLTESGRVVEAQTIILKELETQFGGSARAARQTLGGAFQALKNTAGDLLEGQGGSLTGVTEAINNLEKTLNDPLVKEGFQSIVSGILDIISVAASAVPFIKFLSDEVRAFFGSIDDDDAVRIDNLVQKQKDAIAELERLRTQVRAPGQRADLDRQIEAGRRRLAELEADYQRALDLTAHKTGAITTATVTLGRTSTQVYTGEGGEGGIAGGVKEVNNELDKLIENLRRAEEAEQQRLQARGDQLFDQTRTAAERLNIQLAEYDDLLARNVISWDTYSRAVFQAYDAINEVAEAAPTAATELDEFSKNAAEGIQTSIKNFLIDPFQNGLDGMLRSFGSFVQQIIAEAVAADIARRLFGGLVEGGTGEGAFGSILSGIGGFFGFKATGGTVPAGSFAIAGERGPEIVRGPATITSTRQTANQQSGGPMVFNFNLPGITNRREAEMARGMLARSVMGAIRDSERYA